MLSINYDIEPGRLSIMYSGEICGTIEQQINRVKFTYGRTVGYLASIEKALEFTNIYVPRNPPKLKGENVTCNKHCKKS